MSGAEDHGGEAVESDGELGKDVAVAAELPQHGGGLPEDGQGIVGPREGGVRSAQCPAGGRGAGGHCLQDRRGFVDVLSVEQPGEGRDRAFEASGQGLLGCGELPHRGDGALDHARGEVRVQRDGDGSGREAERGGAAGEVAAPEAAEAGGLEGGPALGREVGDGVQWLEKGPHSAGRRHALYIRCVPAPPLRADHTGRHTTPVATQEERTTHVPAHWTVQEWP